MDELERPIAFLDSGIGGLPYLAAARAELPSERFLYLADRAGFPYGRKSREEVRDRVIGLISSLIGSRAPKAIVVACNTASQAALKDARAAFPGLPIVGTVPAIKPAAEGTRTGVIGVMATEGAVADPYLDDLIRRHAAGVRVIKEAAQDLVDFVESRIGASAAAEREAAVEPHVRRLLDGGADRIVLACTHFLHLRDDIAAAAGGKAETVDSREGVANRLSVLLSSLNLRRDGRGGPAPSVFLITGDPPVEERYGAFAASFGLEGPELFPGG